MPVEDSIYILELAISFCLSTQTTETAAAAAACYLLLITKLTPCEWDKWEKKWKRRCRVVLFGQGNAAC